MVGVGAKPLAQEVVRDVVRVTDPQVVILQSKNDQLSHPEGTLHFVILDLRCEFQTVIDLAADSKVSMAKLLMPWTSSAS